QEIVKLEGLKRLRFSSLDPNEFSAELIDVLITNPLIMPNYHIALQSGSDRILALMRRKYDLATYKNIIKSLQEKLPLLNVSTDIMVGFPGETIEDHQQSLDFAREMGFGSMHVFAYSKRKGTKAALFIDQVSDQDKEHRSKEMLALAEEQKLKFYRNFIDSKLEVLFEQEQQGLWFGHTSNFLKVVVASIVDLRGKYFMVQLNSIEADYLKGELC
ncbi:MAG: radical SAM protein, partial [Clostridia bacterium]